MIFSKSLINLCQFITMMKNLQLISSPSVLASRLVQLKTQCYNHSKGSLFAEVRLSVCPDWTQWACVCAQNTWLSRLSSLRMLSSEIVLAHTWTRRHSELFNRGRARLRAMRQEECMHSSSLQKRQEVASHGRVSFTGGGGGAGGGPSPPLGSERPPPLRIATIHMRNVHVYIWKFHLPQW